jgi:probable F420-dependent oxidoreductase
MVQGVVFGLNIPADAGLRADPVALARSAEKLGFDFVSMNDHVHGPVPRLEAWTTLAWIAASTSRIRLATRVLGVPYRPPAIVAKMAETFSRLSRGRLILGLGAGSGEDEFRRLGLDLRPLSERIAALDDAVQITRGLWAGGSFTYHGRVYRVDDAHLEPRPTHAIPIWLGTHGSRGLELTGRLADGWIPSLEYAPPDKVAAMSAIVRQSALDAGRDPLDVKRIYNVEVSVDGRRQAREHVISGSPSEVAERLVEFTGLGFTGFNLIVTGQRPDRQMAVLARDVIPVVRAAV